jgi:hypothetical protein
LATATATVGQLLQHPAPNAQHPSLTSPVAKQLIATTVSNLAFSSFPVPLSRI